MKRALIVVVAALAIAPLVIGWKKSSPAPKPAPEEIHWITSIDELQAKMQQNPKKVYVDIYTGWCGWCKKMEATTFQNPDLIKYINNNFYAVRFDAERKDTIHFQGKTYTFNPQARINMFTSELLQGKQPSYPTSVLMLENFQSPTPIPGYHDVSEMELYLTYFGDNVFRHQQFDAYQKKFKPVWNHGAAADMTPPAGHSN